VLRVVGFAALLVLATVTSGPALSAASDVDPKSKAEAYAHAAKAALEAADYAAAIAYFEKAVEAAPADATIRDRFAEAVRARARSHGKSEALAAAGQAALQAEAFDKAIGYFEKALEDWRDNPGARAGLAAAITNHRASNKTRALHLARTYARGGDSDKAREQYLLALAADPGDVDVQNELATHIGAWPLPWWRTGLKGLMDALKELLPWIALAAALFLAVVVGVNLYKSFGAPSSVEVLPFDGPETFGKGTGAAMAAIVSSQLHAAGLGLGLGAVNEPITSVIGKISDAPVQILGQLVAWLFPPRGYRLQAVVFELPSSQEIQVTAKLIHLTFSAPRETVKATITFRQPARGPVHETLARLTAAWTEWHVASRRPQYGTNVEQAFAYFVAGLFAERVGSVEVATELYTTAMRLDAKYHKALNNRGRRTLDEGAAAYIKREDSKARRLFQDAAGLFSRAKVLASVPEHHYNLGTALSYLGRVELRAGNRTLALMRQSESMVAYNEALTSLRREAARDDPGDQTDHDPADRNQAERQVFEASIKLMWATSSVLQRDLANAPAEEAKKQRDQEQATVDEATNIFVTQPTIVSHPRLEYSLACYHAVANHLEEAIPIFQTLRAVYPGISRDVLADPDLADIPDVLALFSTDGALPRPPVLPVTVTRAPGAKPDDDPERDEPT
jgi:tetratricopeptide (TPR) repeat protein